MSKAQGSTDTPEGAPVPLSDMDLETVALTDEVHWINECFNIRTGERHIHASVYLIRDPDGNVVVDSGSFHHRSSIQRRLANVTQRDGLQAIILSHTDYPHAANVSAFRNAWGEIEIIASSDVPEIQGLPYATMSKIGETMQICGRRVSFIDPPLADRSHTSWIYDHRSRVMFTADGFGNFHHPSACSLTSVAGQELITVDEIHDYHREAISWLKYVDPDRVLDALSGILETYAISFVAPIHGNPIAQQDLGWYMDRLYQSVVRISNQELDQG